MSAVDSREWDRMRRRNAYADKIVAVFIDKLEALRLEAMLLQSGSAEDMFRRDLAFRNGMAEMVRAHSANVHHAVEQEPMRSMAEAAE